MNNVTEFKEVARELCSLYEKKNKDYGNSFGKTYRSLGIVSAVTRISDKFNRIVQLTRVGKQEVKDESIDDTLMDMASYCIMTLVERRMERIGKVDVTKHQCSVCRHYVEGECEAVKSGAPCMFRLGEDRLVVVKSGKR